MRTHFRPQKTLTPHSSATNRRTMIGVLFLATYNFYAEEETKAHLKQKWSYPRKKYWGNKAIRRHEQRNLVPWQWGVRGMVCRSIAPWPFWLSLSDGTRLFPRISGFFPEDRFQECEERGKLTLWPTVALPDMKGHIFEWYGFNVTFGRQNLNDVSHRAIWLQVPVWNNRTGILFLDCSICLGLRSPRCSCWSLRGIFRDLYP